MGEPPRTLPESQTERKESDEKQNQNQRNPQLLSYIKHV